MNADPCGGCSKLSRIKADMAARISELARERDALRVEISELEATLATVATQRDRAWAQVRHRSLCRSHRAMMQSECDCGAWAVMLEEIREKEAK